MDEQPELHPGAIEGVETQYRVRTRLPAGGFGPSAVYTSRDAIGIYLERPEKYLVERSHVHMRRTPWERVT
jgi:hypothetical protein